MTIIVESGNFASAVAPFGTFEGRTDEIGLLVWEMTRIKYDYGVGRDPEYSSRIGSIVGRLYEILWDLNDRRVTDCSSLPMVPDIIVSVGRITFVTPSSGTRICVTWGIFGEWTLSIDFGPDGSKNRLAIIQERSRELGVKFSEYTE